MISAPAGVRAPGPKAIDRMAAVPASWVKRRSPPLPRRLPAFVYRAFQVSDLAVALLALCAAFVLFNLDRMPHGLGEFLSLRIRAGKALLLVLFAICWIRVFRAFGLYSRGAGGTRRELVRVVVACSVGALATLPFLLFSVSGSFTPGTVFAFWGFSMPLVIGMRTAIKAAATPLSSEHPRQVLIVGSGPRARKLWRTLRGPKGAGTHVIGFVDTSHEAVDSIVRRQLLGDLGDLEGLLMRRVVDEVLITLPIKSCYQQIQETIHTCERVGVQSSYLADILQPSLGRMRYERAQPFTTLTVKVVQEDYRLVVKRAIDVLGAGLGLVVLGPLLLVIAGAIKLTGPGPVLFAQQRYGYNKRLFRMYKFRTMVPDAEAQQASLEKMNEAKGPIFKIARDPRITPLGRLLRRTSLDELPQLWNVLVGDMSLVGPRPMDTRDVGLFEEGRMMRRFSVRPGLTCLWQISGRSNLAFEQWIQLDLDYIDRWSLSLDWSILVRTLPAVIRGSGAL